MRMCRHLAEQAWARLLGATDWGDLARQVSRLPAGDMEALLAGTPLAAAAAKCYAEQPRLRCLCLGHRWVPFCLPVLPCDQHTVQVPEFVQHGSIMGFWSALL